MAKINDDGSLTLNKLEVLMVAGAMAIAKGTIYKDHDQSITIGKMTFHLARKTMSAEQFSEFRSALSKSCDPAALGNEFTDKAGQIMADTMTQKIKGLNISEIDLGAIKQKYGSK